MANPVLSRPMFKQSPTASPVAPTVGGIGGMTTPDQNAQALKSMFAPTVPAARPTQSFPTPQAGYKRGGEVIDGVAHFAEGGEGMIGPPAPPEEPGVGTKLLNAAKDIGNIPYQIYQGVVGGKPVSLTPNYDENVRRPRGETGEAPTSPAQKIGAAAADIAGLPVRGTQYIGNKIDPREVPPVTSLTPNYDVYRVEEEAQQKRNTEERLRAATRAALAAPVTGTSFQEEAAGSGILKAIANPPPAKPAADTELQIQSIRARREASERQREENKWMGLLSAGLGMMAGTNRNAFANIGAGGQQGIATFAGLEKARREDDASRRQESYQQQQLSLQTQQLAQQKEIAFAQLAKDPDAVRTYAALGGWKAGDPPEKYQEAALAGYEKAHAAERIKALRDYIDKAAMTGANPEDVKRANAELLRLGLNSGAGTSSGSQFKLLGAKP